MDHTTCRLALLASLCTPLLAASVEAQVEVTYDHKKDCPASSAAEAKPPGCYQQRTVSLQPGKKLRVVIANTTRAAFRHSIHGLTVATEVSPQIGSRSAATDVVTLVVTHDEDFGGYVVTIEDTLPKNADRPQLAVGNAVLVIQVDSKPKPYSFGGGMALTSLTNERFEARQDFDTTFAPGGGVASVDTSFIIQADEGKRDRVSVGFSTFLNVHPWPDTKGLDRASFNFGVGLETTGNTLFYVGLGYKIHDGIYLNAGYVTGNVDALPKGLRLDDRIDDPNQLAELGRRQRGGIFFGGSFAFLGGGQAAFGKPFAGAEQK